MKEKVSFTLASDVLAEVDRSVGKQSNRSAFIESVLREYFKSKVREAIYARDLELINAHIDYLANESRELDEYQTPIDWESDTQ